MAEDYEFEFDGDCEYDPSHCTGHNYTIINCLQWGKQRPKIDSTQNTVLYLSKSKCDNYFFLLQTSHSNIIIVK